MTLRWVVLSGAILLVCLCAVRGQEDCRNRMEAQPCSNFANVGVCNETTGICKCENIVLNTTLECFELDVQENFCNLMECYDYFDSSGECRKGQLSRTTALLLSIFLINFGAANFYIERYELAVPQIFFGLLLCIFQFGSCAVAAARKKDVNPLCIFCCSVNSILSLLFLSWWIADLIIFATNNRDDGNGCPLYT